MVTRTHVLIPIAAAAVIVGVFGMLTFPTDVKLESVEFPRGTIQLDDKIFLESSVKKIFSTFLLSFLRASVTACFPAIKKVDLFMFLSIYHD